MDTNKQTDGQTEFAAADALRILDEMPQPQEHAIAQAAADVAEETATESPQ